MQGLNYLPQSQNCSHENDFYAEKVSFPCPNTLRPTAPQFCLTSCFPFLLAFLSPTTPEQVEHFLSQPWTERKAPFLSERHQRKGQPDE